MMVKINLQVRSKDIIELGKKDSWKDVNWDVFSSKIEENIINQFKFKVNSKSK